MALAGLAQGAIIDMKCQLYHHPKFAGTFRKVHAGLVKAAGKPCFVLCIQSDRGHPH